MRRLSIGEVRKRGKVTHVSSIFEIDGMRHVVDYVELGQARGDRVRARLSGIFQRREIEEKRTPRFDAHVLN